LLADREQALAAVMEIYETYSRDGIGPAMAGSAAASGAEDRLPGTHSS
jgi:hypothetical protein